jgi:hypothetical protein
MRVIDECYNRAIDVLKGNIADVGFKASRDRYNSVWGRDASITCMGAVLTGDSDLIEASRRSLFTLRDKQTLLGQIPNCYSLETSKVTYYATDATAWWVLAVHSMWHETKDTQFIRDMWPAVEDAITWLGYQCLDNSRLIDSPPAADWMDSSVQRSGKVLYNNVLYCRMLTCARELMVAQGVPATDGTAELKQMINVVFWPDGGVRDPWLSGWDSELYDEIIDANREHYLNYLSYETYDDSCDVGANCMAIIWDVADHEKTEKILGFMETRHVARPFPVRVLEPVITQPGMLWNSKIDIYRPRHWQNLPFCYHNGAIWPWVGGLYVTALVKAGKHKAAEKALTGLAAANKAGQNGGWEFNEWLHGRTGIPTGSPLQSWSASGYIMAYKAVTEGVLP